MTAESAANATRELLLDAVDLAIKAETLGHRTYSGKILRDTVFYLHEKGTEPKFDAKRRFSQDAWAKFGALSKRDLSKQLTWDHAIPLSYLRERVFAKCKTRTELAESIDRYVTSCVITRDEDRRLSDLGLRDSMPIDWDGQDIFGRYRVADIPTILPSSVPSDVELD